MFASTQVIGNLISLVVLRNDKDGGGAEEKNLLFTVFLGCMVVGIVLMFLLSRRDENIGVEGGDHELPEKSLLWDMSKSAVAPLADRRMLLLAPLLAYYGLQKAFVCPVGGVLGSAAPLLVGAVWGVGDGILNTQLSALIGLLFKDKEAAFALGKMWQAAATAVVFFLSPGATLQGMLAAVAAALVVALTAFLSLSLVVERSYALKL
ncbi:hypothetical protein ACQ4PT_033184 [Festuca glaucescens]